MKAYEFCYIIVKIEDFYYNKRSAPTGIHAPLLWVKRFVMYIDQNPKHMS